MKRLSMSLVGMLLASPVFADATLERQLAYTSLHLIDWAQTREIARNPRFVETNKILGPKPKQYEVNRYFAATLASHWLITYTLPPEARPYWQWGTIAVEAVVVGRNARLGVSLTWR